jgi:sugar/nucleoside kinase (ribokinase family)
VGFITRLGDDAFAEIAERTWGTAGVRPLVTKDAAS